MEEIIDVGSLWKHVLQTEFGYKEGHGQGHEEPYCQVLYYIKRAIGLQDLRSLK